MLTKWLECGVIGAIELKWVPLPPISCSYNVIEHVTPFDFLCVD